MNNSEKALLMGVRTAIINANIFSSDECKIEHDEFFPPTVGTKACVVCPAGYRRHENHGSSGGIKDLVFSISVTVALRVGQIARDKMHDGYLFNLLNLQNLVEAVCDVIDFNIDTMGLINTQLTTLSEPGQGFHFPLVFSNVDAKPRLAPPDMFAESTRHPGTSGLIRAIYFDNARRTWIRT